MLLLLYILLVLIVSLLLLILTLIWTSSIVLLVVLSGTHAGRRRPFDDLSLVILIVLAPLRARIAKPSSLPYALCLLCFLVVAVIHD